MRPARCAVEQVRLLAPNDGLDTSGHHRLDMGDVNARVDDQHKNYEVRDGGMDAPRRDWRLVAAGVVLLLVVLVVTGRLQSRGPGVGGVGPSAPAAATTAPDSSSGLSVAGRVRLPGPPAAVAVGEGAVWVLLEGNRLLRVDPERHRVTGSVDLAPPGDGSVGTPWRWARARSGCARGKARR
jgi:hypothetical protein